MSRRREIPQTKRSTYRPMNQMNGDFLTQLKRPRCSEFSQEIRGTNRGNEASCKFKISLWYKDKEFNMRKIDRSEDAIYDTFLRTYKEKRQLQREAYKRQQLTARKAAENAREMALQNIDRLVLPETDENPPEYVGVQSLRIDDVKQEIVQKFAVEVEPMVEAGYIDAAATSNSQTIIGEPQKQSHETVAKSKVLEVSKRDPLNPLVRERSNSFVESEKEPDQDLKANADDNRTTQMSTSGNSNDAESLETDSKTAMSTKRKEDYLPENELSKQRDKNNNKSTKKPLDEHMSEMELITKVNINVKQHSRRGANFTNFMPPISEQELPDVTSLESYSAKVCRSQPASPKCQSGKAQNTQTPSPLKHSEPSSASSKHHPESPSKHSTNSPPKASPLHKFQSKSLDFLDFGSSDQEEVSTSSPPVSLVLLNKRRMKERDRMRKRILNSEPLMVYMKTASGEIQPAITGFKRKTFDPPSSKEKYFQKKMLLSQRQAIEAQSDKIEKFFEKLDIDKDKEFERRFRQVRPPSVEEKFKKDLPNLGVSLEQVAKVFNRRHESLPEELDPESIEAMQFCGYLRAYDLDEPKDSRRSSSFLNY